MHECGDCAGTDEVCIVDDPALCLDDCVETGLRAARHEAPYAFAPRHIGY